MTVRFLADDSTSTYFDQKLQDPAGPIAQHINTVFWPIFWVSVVVLVAVGGTIIYSALRFRRKSDDEEPEQVHGNNKLEIGWTVVPFLILITLFGITFANMDFIDNIPAGQKASALNVCVQGQRFNWSYFYEGSCGQSHAGSIPDSVDYTPTNKAIPKSLTLVVPINQPVQLHLVSVDVNHSFFIPQISGQVNAIPGQNNELWLQIDKPGIYHGACTELCGSNHYAMLVCIDARTADDFFLWLSQKKAGKPVTKKEAPCAFPPIPQ